MNFLVRLDLRPSDREKILKDVFCIFNFEVYLARLPEYFDKN